MADILNSALTGASLGSAIAPGIGTLIGGAGGAILGGLFSDRGGPTGRQQQQQQLIDQLLAGVKGEGQFANLFSMDNASFQKNFADPARNMFKSQIAPQIQQSFIQSGQQRGTGMDDQLLRAGVNMDDMLNQYLMQYQQGAQNRQMSGINAILGSGAGAQEAQTTGQAMMQGLGGYLTSGDFGKNVSGLAKTYGDWRDANPPKPTTTAPIGEPLTKGIK